MTDTDLNSASPHNDFAPHDHWLLVSDVDNTLLGDREALVEFFEILDASDVLILALNSSRPCADVHVTLQELPVDLQPRAIIGAMGTEIELDGHPLDEWRQKFAGWNRGPIDAALESMGFEAHPSNLQTPLKVSYAVPQSDQEDATEAVRATGIPTRIIPSGISDFDVLPPKAGKGSATVFLARRLGVAFDRLIVAGDSANDVEMFNSVDRGIVVGNASSRLREAVDRSKVFFAKGDHAAGLIEGLRHWNVPINETTS